MGRNPLLHVILNEGNLAVVLLLWFIYSALMLPTYMCLPNVGSVLGMENWIRITFAIVPSSLQDGLERIKSFCQRHKKKQINVY
jgi:hypothetical protein